MPPLLLHVHWHIPSHILPTINQVDKWSGTLQRDSQYSDMSVLDIYTLLWWLLCLESLWCKSTGDSTGVLCVSSLLNVPSLRCPKVCRYQRQFVQTVCNVYLVKLHTHTHTCAHIHTNFSFCSFSSLCLFRVFTVFCEMRVLSWHHRLRCNFSFPPLFFLCWVTDVGGHTDTCSFSIILYYTHTHTHTH